jgi:hypothetical protein
LLLFSVAELVLKHMGQVGSRCNVVLGTHNETSTLRAVAKIRSLGLDPASGTLIH